MYEWNSHLLSVKKILVYPRGESPRESRPLFQKAKKKTIKKSKIKRKVKKNSRSHVRKFSSDFPLEFSVPAGV